MSKNKKQAKESLQLARDAAIHRQFKNVKRKAAPVAHQDSGKPPTLTGQPRPLTTTFEQLRERALATPVLDGDIDKLDPDNTLDRHTKVIDYNRNYLLAVTVLAVLKEERFFWQVNSFMVSKASGKNVKVSLMPTKTVTALTEALAWGLDDCGIKHETIMEKRIDALYFSTPFKDVEYDLLLAPFRELTVFREMCGCGDKPLSEPHDCYLGM